MGHGRRTKLVIDEFEVTLLRCEAKDRLNHVLPITPHYPGGPRYQRVVTYFGFTGEFRLPVDRDRIWHVPFGIGLRGLAVKDVVGRHVTHLCSNGSRGFVDPASTECVYLVGKIRIVLTRVHLGHRSSVDYYVGLEVADNFAHRLTRGNVHLVDV